MFGFMAGWNRESLTRPCLSRLQRLKVMPQRVGKENNSALV